MIESQLLLFLYPSYASKQVSIGYLTSKIIWKCEYLLFTLIHTIIHIKNLCGGYNYQENSREMHSLFRNISNISVSC